MKNFLKVMIIVAIVGILTACMNTNNDRNQPEPNDQNKTNNEQTEEEFDQDNSSKQREKNRDNQDDENNQDNEREYDRNENNQDNKREYDRNENGNHHKGHHERRERPKKDSKASSEYSNEEIVLENDAFQIFEPAPKASVKNEIIVRGLARVFEGTIQYQFRDNHSILDEGYTTTSEGTEEWNEFEIIIKVDKSAHRSARIILYEESAKDGSKINELTIPVHVNQ